MKSPESESEFKKLPIGTKLILIRNLAGVCNEIRIVKEVHENYMILISEGKLDSYLVLPAIGVDFFCTTDKTFGFKLEDNTILVEYKLVGDQKC